MNDTENTITKFYTAFANSDFNSMSQCYAADAQFRDPVFGTLTGDQISMMWKMLLERSNGNLKVIFSDCQANEFMGSALWEATYIFSKTNKMVVNTIAAQFQFKNGLIIKHVDEFDLYKWSKQAFGVTGFLLGWTGFFQKKIQQQAQETLRKYISKHSKE
ncbi:nuclear transport factor 2 family protein [Flavobacterium sp. XS1P32]|uniref:nuclear transport factor 2 family protein n=1 Tax=unclassified Flavobacterium TaxID=196869 RepID=UPI003AAFF50D